METLISVACVPVRLTHPSWSVRFHSTLAVGISGDPSYKTTEAPTASADTSQFHIIQPVCGQIKQRRAGYNTFLSSPQLNRLKNGGCKAASYTIKSPVWLADAQSIVLEIQRTKIIYPILSLNDDVCSKKKIITRLTMNMCWIQLLLKLLLNKKGVAEAPADCRPTVV